MTDDAGSDTGSRDVAERMAEAAAAWLDSLDPDQREVGAGAVPSAEAEPDAERRRWFYTPTDHGGLTFHAQRPAQQRQLAGDLARVQALGILFRQQAHGVEAYFVRHAAGKFQVQLGHAAPRVGQVCLHGLELLQAGKACREDGREWPEGWRCGHHHGHLRLGSTGCAGRRVLGTTHACCTANDV